MNIRVAISGKMGSGKTTLAKALQIEFSQMPDLYDTNGFYPEIRGFGTPIRDLLREGGIGKDHPHFRQAAQNVGMAMRQIDPEFWIRVFHNTAKGSVIIDDLRFKNEFEWCKSHGFYLIRLNTMPFVEELMTQEKAHVSETDLDNQVGWDNLFVAGSQWSVDTIAEIFVQDIRDYFLDSEVQRRGITETLSPGTAAE